MRANLGHNLDGFPCIAAGPAAGNRVPHDLSVTLEEPLARLLDVLRHEEPSAAALRHARGEAGLELALGDDRRHLDLSQRRGDAHAGEVAVRLRRRARGLAHIDQHAQMVPLPAPPPDLVDQLQHRLDVPPAVHDHQQMIGAIVEVPGESH